MHLAELKRDSWLDFQPFRRIPINGETLFWIALLVLALFSRFYILGARVMSHDENSHVYYSWRFYKGEGFSHDPLMHGPLQFHLIAPAYFMFGDNDFTGRIPAAVFSVATVMFLWFYRRYLGHAGAMVAGLLMLISPYMLYYGRYARNEAFVGLFGVAMIWAILRYLETGKSVYLFTLTAVNVLHFTAKETSFIYSAQAMLFLGGYFVYRLSKASWERPKYRDRFLLALIIILILLGAAGGYFLLTNGQKNPHLVSPVAPGGPGSELSPLPAEGMPALLIAAAVLIGVILILAGYFLLKGYGLENLRQNRAFSLLIVMGTLILPQLAAFPVRMMGWKIPTNASEVMMLNTVDILQIAVFLIPLGAISVILGLLWKPRLWLINAAIWYGIFTVFYTSVFTNGAGFFTGLVGSLGYWLEQQGVQRGSQPIYYYALVQVPIYEYLPALGTWLAFGMAAWGLWRLKPKSLSEETEAESQESGSEELPTPELLSAAECAGCDESAAEEHTHPAPAFALMGFWAITSLIAYTIAGEKMPWLTVHITLPAILCAGWSLNRLIKAMDWRLIGRKNGWLILLLLPVALFSLFGALSSLLGSQPPFQGKQLAELQATSQFLMSALTALISGAGLFYLVRSWAPIQFIRLLSLTFFAILAVLTARVSIQANYYDYDYANELLVYAHSAPGVKTALNQIEEISRRTTDGLAIRVAYDNETSYPYWWYLRNYSNSNYFGANPSRALRDFEIILVGDANFGKIEPVVANLFDRFDYIRLWWPNQDYYDLSWERVRNALSNPEMRAALFQIWLNRDYSEYGRVLGRDMSMPNWSPAARMRLYIRKDITSKLWNYGSVPMPVEELSDPLEGLHIDLAASSWFGSAGAEAGQFQRPRDVAIAPDGTLYVADTENNRIQHLTPQGEVLHIWGSFGDAAAGQAPGGTFNQPWGIGVGPDGSVFVADTWNHRVQKFDADGKFLDMWGYFGQAETPEAFWGPRDVTVDAAGRFYITDTGNKRVVVFSETGEYLSQFGGAGMGYGQLDEPVGIAVDTTGLIYVADTWNQRIQIFQPDEEDHFTPLRSWELQAWYGQSLDNKPFLAVDELGSLFVSDPEGYRVLQYKVDGEPVRSWGDYGAGLTQFGMPAGLAVDKEGALWVVDAGGCRLMRFTLP